VALTPEEAMRRALAQARRADGRTWPNPPVGAVLVRGDRVLGRGATRPPGGAHAEIVALAAARRRHGPRAARGATLAVTLEPCAHHGRTGPCVDAILEAGVRRVWIGHRDPSPWTGGKGLRRLRAAGVEVTSGVLERECRHQHRGFLSIVERGRPWVELKLAGSLDGRIATARGESRWITGERARAFVHRLRARADAVMVGSETALADDPELVARRGARVVRRPVRVLVDSGLRVPATARLHRGEGASWVLFRRDAPARRVRALARAGVEPVPVARRGDRLDLRAALRALAARGLTQVLVEGGGELAAALLRADLVDEVHWFVAPKLLGGDGRPALGPIGAGRLARAVVLVDREVRRMGQDLYVRGRVVRGTEEDAG
jgi:diaminohydroxyphosphoribosylaminopyrimidine deaminase/5-amino-6-(5-phosphoribosylamino)uracil reductase